MALVTNKSVFLHIPKCCGLFIRHIFKTCKIDHFELGDQHSHFPDIAVNQPPGFFDKRFIFSFVRHPLTWYQSRWAFRVKHGWKLQHPLDYHCASNDFAMFVDNLLKYKPDGWFTWECRSFINQCPRPIDFVGRTENLVDDVIKALMLAGESFNPAVVRKCPVVNDSNIDGRPPKYWAPYTEQLAKRVMAVEQEVVHQYYPRSTFDYQTLCGDRPY